MGTAGDTPAEQQPSAASPPAPAKRTLVFTYGTLKRGLSNHGLLQDLARSGDASFVGAAATVSPLPLVCVPYRVPFLLNLPGSGHCVKGELYSVMPRGLARLDELEGVSRGHYERLPVEVVLAEGDEGRQVVEGAAAYYAHRGYATEMWARSGRRGHAEYSPAVLGFGWAGIFRRYLVEPAAMWWPSNLVQVSLFREIIYPFRAGASAWVVRPPFDDLQRHQIPPQYYKSLPGVGKDGAGLPAEP